ncbi:MAG TPA: hypothetical protein VHE55_05895 [Fimbriimonadaceae bacterium]|nr:hypothetical protein [Fimbriimonadaceae bacterium]
MSTKFDPAEFTKACDRATRLCTPVHFRHLRAWLGDWKEAAERMHYLKIEQFGISDSLRTIIRIKGSLRRPNLSLDLIKPDLETLWSEVSAEADEASHTIWNHEKGFEFAFFAIENNSYVTGSFTILRAA